MKNFARMILNNISA